jgi:hypothetical protein
MLALQLEQLPKVLHQRTDVSLLVDQPLRLFYYFSFLPSVIDASAEEREFTNYENLK